MPVLEIKTTNHMWLDYTLLLSVHRNIDPTSIQHLDKNVNETDNWNLHITYIIYVSSSCQFHLHFYLYGLPGCLTYMQGFHPTFNY